MRVCGSDCSKQSKTADGPTRFLDHAKSSVSAYARSNASSDLFEDKNSESVIFKDPQRCVGARPTHALDTKDTCMGVVGYYEGI